MLENSKKCISDHYCFFLGCQGKLTKKLKLEYSVFLKSF